MNRTLNLIVRLCLVAIIYIGLAIGVEYLTKLTISLPRLIMGALYILVFSTSITFSTIAMLKKFPKELKITYLIVGMLAGYYVFRYGFTFLGFIHIGVFFMHTTGLMRYLKSDDDQDFRLSNESARLDRKRKLEANLRTLKDRIDHKQP